jgi:thiamine-phosphate pyrophosphorylase
MDMRQHHSLPLPRIWLMTDERMGDRLKDALDQLPKGSGVVFRHFSLPDPARRQLFDAVRRRTRSRRIVLSLADTPQKAAAWRADGVHGLDRRRTTRPMVRIVPVHNVRELELAQKCRADLIFVSPVYDTRTHPWGKTLGRIGLAKIAGQAHRPVIALGGMTSRRAARLSGIAGWAAIDAWLNK